MSITPQRRIRSALKLHIQEFVWVFICNLCWCTKHRCMKYRDRRVRHELDFRQWNEDKSRCSGSCIICYLHWIYNCFEKSPYCAQIILEAWNLLSLTLALREDTFSTNYYIFFNAWNRWKFYTLLTLSEKEI